MESNKYADKLATELLNAKDHLPVPNPQSSPILTLTFSPVA
jgi:hypothetical protein